MPHKSKKLFGLESLAFSEAPRVESQTRDPAIIEDKLSRYLIVKWGCRLLDRIGLMSDFLDTHEGCSPGFSVTELCTAMRRMRKLAVTDANGECLELWSRAFCASKAAVTTYFNHLAASRVLMANFLIHARAHGKSSSSPKLETIRFIMPLPAQLAIIDAMLAARVHSFLATRDFLPRETFAGAVPKTQVLDITVAASRRIKRDMTTSLKRAWRSRTSDNIMTISMSSAAASGSEMRAWMALPAPLCYGCNGSHVL